MASDLSTVLSNLKTSLGLPNGVGDYTYDLTGADRVSIGTTWPPPLLPSVQVHRVEGVSETGTDTQSFIRRYRFPITAYVGAPVDSAEARSLAAADLLSDILIALGASFNGQPKRQLGTSNVRDVVVTDQEAWGTPDGVTPSLGIVSLTVEIHFKTSNTLGT